MPVDNKSTSKRLYTTTEVATEVMLSLILSCVDSEVCSGAIASMCVLCKVVLSMQDISQHSSQGLPNWPGKQCKTFLSHQLDYLMLWTGGDRLPPTLCVWAQNLYRHVSVWTFVMIQANVFACSITSVALRLDMLSHMQHGK